MIVQRIYNKFAVKQHPYKPNGAKRSAPAQRHGNTSTQY